MKDGLGDLVLTECELRDNSITGSFGGAVYNYGGGSLSISDSTFIGNVSPRVKQEGTLTITREIGRN